MISRGTYLRSTVSFWARSAQLRRRVLNSDATCLSARAATGGNALINTDCPSLTAARSVSLMILGAPASPPRGAQLINVWVTVVFPYWYLDWWWRFRNKRYWPAEEWYVSNCLADVFMCNGYNVGGSGGYPRCANVYIWPIHADYPVCMCGAWRGEINIPTIKNSLL